jgi:hypothetical protein
MKKRIFLRKGLIIGTTCLFLMIAIPSVMGDTYTYDNASWFFIYGRSNDVNHNGLWTFGLTYLHNRDVTIKMKSSDETRLGIIVLKPTLGFHHAKNKDMTIQLINTKGFFFWGEKSLLLKLDQSPILAVCTQAARITVTV